MVSLRTLMIASAWLGLAVSRSSAMTSLNDEHDLPSVESLEALVEQDRRELQARIVGGDTAPANKYPYFVASLGCGGR